MFFLSFFVLIFLIYGQSLTGGFVFDDRGIIEHSELLSNLGNLKETALYPYWTVEAGLYRPVTLLSYSFNFIFLGSSPAGFHFINLLLYLAICISIYFLIKKLFRNGWLAYLVALLFLVLPIHTEVVANITGRSELLALLFSLLVLLEFTREKVVAWRIGLWLLLAIGSKETAIAAIPLALMVLAIKERESWLGSVKRHFKGLTALVVATSLYFFMRFIVLGPTHFFGVKTSLIENPLIFADIPARFATASSILWMYVQKLFWPVNLCSDYSYNQIPVIHSFLNLEVILGLVILFGAVAVIIMCFRKRSAISFGAAIFLFSFLPVSNILFPVGTIAGERLFFFPSLGFALVVAVGLYALLSKSVNKNSRIAVLIMIVLVLLSYGFLAFKRQTVWLSEEKLFLSAVECSPNSVLSRSNAGAAYLFMGNLERAAEELEISRAIKPIYSKGLNNLGLVYWKQGENREAENLYMQSLQQEFPYYGAIENLVLLYLSERDYTKARHWLQVLYPNNEKLVDSIIQNSQEVSD